MSKAEERAQAYENGLDYYHYTGDNPSVAYKAGYEQAEKDLAPTWEDVKRIVKIADRLCPYTSKEIAEFQAEFQSEEAYYKEVLKRFNDTKEEKK